MGLFSAKNKAALYTPAPVDQQDSKTYKNVKFGKHGRANDTPEDACEDQDTDDAGGDVEKKQYAKDKAPMQAAAAEATAEARPEMETLLNTKLNAMLYHTSEDSIDLYRRENNSLDLMGRLYYDDYDPDNRHVVDRVTPFTSLQALARAPASSGISSNLDQTTVDIVRTGQNSQNSQGIQNPQHPHSLQKPQKPLFARQVSFDTLSDTHHLAITLKVKHPDFKFRRNNKTFLIGFSNDLESMKAVAWVFLEMVISGDTIIVLQVLDEKAYSFVDPQLAEIVLQKLQKLNTHSKRISLVYEVVIGNPQKLLKKAILEYKPAMMIVGTRQYGPAPTSEPSLPPPTSGDSNLLTNLPSLSHPQPPVKGTSHHLPTISHPLTQNHHSPLHRSLFSKSSISKYCLQYALVPVIIVKPFYNIQETLQKPVDSETYFRDWLANIDIAHTREKKKKHMFGICSPLLSHNLSHSSLTDFLHHDRSHERIHETIHEKLQEKLQEISESRGRLDSDKFHFSLGGSRDPSPSRSRSRSAPARDKNGDAIVDSIATLDARSRSRSRSRLSRMLSG